MFPWESDDTGEEATPTWALTGIFEQHITADVSIAFWNYYAMTQDKTWLKKEWNVLKETTDFG
jgi:trehalose/maltose hydrolase-like predicted phosphorylase